MLRKLICIIFATCVLYAVPAHALSTNQLESRLKPYIQNEISAALQQECAKYNARPPREIKANVARLDKQRCAVLVFISDYCDPRAVAVIADMIAVQSINILNKLGMSDRQMQQAGFRISVMPVAQNNNGKFSAYDASIVYWEGTTPKLEWLDAETVESALGLNKQ